MRIKRLAVIFAVVLCGTSAFAAVASACSIYAGSPGGNWGTAANWSPQGVPGANDDVCIPQGGDVVFAPYMTTEEVYSDTVKSITIASGGTLEIDGEGSSYNGDYYKFSDLYVNNGVNVNSGGTLLLDATGVNALGNPAPTGQTPGGAANLFVNVDPPAGTTATLTNNGTIDAQTSSALFGEYIQGAVQNAGTLNDNSGVLTIADQGVASSNSATMTVAAGASTMLAGSPGFTNSGHITASGALTLTSLSPQAWTQSGGSVTGNTVSLYNGDTLNYGSGTGSFAFGAGGSENFISGTIPAGQTVSLQAATSGNGNAIVGVNGTLTNNGTFVMNTPAGATGNPEVDPGPSGGNFVNNAAVNLVDATAAQSNLFRADLTNSATGTVDVESGTTYYDGGNNLLNQGTLLIAPSASFTQKAGTVTNSGTLSPQISSTTGFGVYDLYGGTFDAGGTLSPVLLGGYVPAAGQEFVLLNIGNTDTFSGTFAGGGNGFTVDSSHVSPQPGSVGAIYATSAASSPPAESATQGTIHAAKPISKAGKLTVKLSCPANQKCAAYTETATITEHLNGKTLIGLAAAKKKTTSKVITIARVKGSVAAGKSVTVKLTLNKTGAALLKRYGKLKTVVALTVGGKTISKSTVTLTEPKPAKKKKKK